MISRNINWKKIIISSNVSTGHPRSTAGIPMNNFTVLGSCITLSIALYVVYRRLNPLPPPGTYKCIPSGLDKYRCVAVGLSFPPGPQGNPILGHLNTDIYDIALLDEWRKKYGKFQQSLIGCPWLLGTLGDIVSVNVLGTRNVILYTQELVTEFFERRSKIYSDRPPQPMLQLYVRYL